MRVVLGFLIGLLIGGAAMIWFYTYGGKIMIAGRELGPPITYVKGDDPPKAPETKTPRVVVRDITDEAPKPAPVVPRSGGVIVKIALAVLAVVRGSLLSGHDGKKAPALLPQPKIPRPLQVT